MPDFWEDQKKAEAQMKKVKSLHFWIDSYTEIEKSVEELKLAFDFVKEGYRFGRGGRRDLSPYDDAD